MPTYVYACKACDHRFEQYQSFTDESLTICPECQGALRKVFNSVGVVFKGSGFYRNDARGTKSSSALHAATANEGGSSDAAQGGTTSAPAPKESVTTGASAPSTSTAQATSPGGSQSASSPSSAKAAASGSKAAVA